MWRTEKTCPQNFRSRNQYCFPASSVRIQLIICAMSCTFFFFFFKVSIANSETGPGVKNCPWRATQFPDPRLFFAK